MLNNFSIVFNFTIQKYYILPTNNQKKLIRSLSQKKNRIKHNLFVAEGPKVIKEFIDAKYDIELLFTTDSSLFPEVPSVLTSEKDLKAISYLTTPNQCLAVFKIPKLQEIPQDSLQVALDAVRDPGNLGTIIRLCDWFGISDLVCSTDSVDCYNPKVVQASMGSLARLRIQYLDLETYLKNTNLPVYGAFMDGDSVYKTSMPSKAILLMGNEANGIRENIEPLVTDRISIPRFGALQVTESLNVATATAILLSEFKRSEL